MGYCFFPSSNITRVPVKPLIECPEIVGEIL